MPGSARAWKWMVVQDWTLISASPCPRNQFILCPCPATALNEGEPETGSAQKHPPMAHSPVLSLFFFWMIHTRCHVYGGEWMTRKIIRWCRAFNALATRGGKQEGRLEEGVLLLSIQWRENWSMQVSDVGFNVRRERSICIVAAQMAGADRMFWVPLLADLSDPASACVPVKLAPASEAWHSLTWNYCVWEPQTISHTSQWPVVVFVLSANQSLAQHDAWIFTVWTHGRCCCCTHASNHNKFSI